MTMTTKKPRYSISVDDEMFERIEDYRFLNRFPNRSEATVDLIRRGLESLEREEEEREQKEEPIQAEQ